MRSSSKVWGHRRTVDYFRVHIYAADGRSRDLSNWADINAIRYVIFMLVRQQQRINQIVHSQYVQRFQGDSIY